MHNNQTSVNLHGLFIKKIGLLSKMLFAGRIRRPAACEHSEGVVVVSGTFLFVLGHKGISNALHKN